MCAIPIICLGVKGLRWYIRSTPRCNYLLTDSSGSSVEDHATPFVTSTKELSSTIELFFKEILQKCFVLREMSTPLLKAAMQPFEKFDHKKL